MFQFNNKGGVVMIWGGKILSQGEFSTAGQNIKIKEALPGGTTREFPFWVIRLTDKEIVFETTTGEDKSRITAEREGN